MEAKSYDILTQVKHLVEKDEVTADDYDQALLLIENTVELNYKRIRQLKVNLYTSSKNKEDEILNLIREFEERNDILMFQKAKIYRKLGIKNDNHEMIKESIRMFTELDQSFLVKLNIVRALLALGELEHDIKYIEMANKIIKEHGIEAFNKGIVVRVNELIKELNMEVECGKNYNDLRTIYTKLYSGNVSLEEINSAEIMEWDKEILCIAYYEKSNKNKGISFVKSLKLKYAQDPDKIKILNRLKGCMESKKNSYFDIGKYGEIMSVSVDFNQVEDKVVEETEDVVIPEKKIEIVSRINTPKKAKVAKRIVCIGGGKTINRYTNNSSNSNTNQIVNQSNTTVEHVSTIGEVYHEEAMAVAAYLFACTGDVENRGIWVKRLDNFMALIDYPVTNSEKFDKFMKILIGCNNSHVLKHQIDMDVIKRDSISKKKIKESK